MTNTGDGDRIERSLEGETQTDPLEMGTLPQRQPKDDVVVVPPAAMAPMPNDTASVRPTSSCDGTAAAS